MDSCKLNFLQTVIGADGASALAKATAASPDLEWAIFPRVVMGWLEVASHAPEAIETLPGTDIKFLLRKNADGYSGYVVLGAGSNSYGFRDATLYHVSGAVAVALGASPDMAPELRSPALAKLGKSVDLLVRSRTLRKMQERHAGGAKGKLPGTTAAPRLPQGPVAPIPTQPQQASQVGTKVAIAVKPNKAGFTSGAVKAPSIKLPGIKPKKPTLKVAKSEARACGACGGLQFKGGRYSGCACFAALAKSVRTVVTDDSYVLEFGAGWDHEAIAALAENLGK